MPSRAEQLTFIDLSGPIESSPADVIEQLRVEIDYQDHGAGAELIETMLGVPRRLLRDGEGWANEEIRRLGTHSTTHVDAPWHYNSQIRGERAQTIDELPLEWFFSRGVVLDMTAKGDGEAISPTELQAALEHSGHVLRPLDIVLVRTGRDAHYGELDYMARGPAVTAEATAWLFDRGVRVMGIDAWGWDGPLHLQAEAAKRADRAGVFWAAHQADLPYSQIERLCNLGALPATGFHVACFPLRIVGAGAAPARVVALVADNHAER
jgi:kynurenine formamidase